MTDGPGEPLRWSEPDGTRRPLTAHAPGRSSTARVGQCGRAEAMFTVEAELEAAGRFASGVNRAGGGRRWTGVILAVLLLLVLVGTIGAGLAAVLQ